MRPAGRTCLRLWEAEGPQTDVGSGSRGGDDCVGSRQLLGIVDRRLRGSEDLQFFSWLPEAEWNLGNPRGKGEWEGE